MKSENPNDIPAISASTNLFLAAAVTKTEIEKLSDLNPGLRLKESQAYLFAVQITEHFYKVHAALTSSPKTQRQSLKAIVERIRQLPSEQAQKPAHWFVVGKLILFPQA